MPVLLRKVAWEMFDPLRSRIRMRLRLHWCLSAGKDMVEAALIVVPAIVLRTMIMKWKRLKLHQLMALAHLRHKRAKSSGLNKDPITSTKADGNRVPRLSPVLRPCSNRSRVKFKLKRGPGLNIVARLMQRARSPFKPFAFRTKSRRAHLIRARDLHPPNLGLLMIMSRALSRRVYPKKTIKQ